MFLILSSPHYTTSFWLTVELCLRAKANTLEQKSTPGETDMRKKNVKMPTIISVAVQTIVDKNWGDLG